MLLKRVSSDVFPAYAGMIPGEGTQQERQFRVPRIRGDDQTMQLADLNKQSCSPHTRG